MNAETRPIRPPIDWINIVFLSSVHLLAVAGVVYLATVKFSWWTVGLAFLWFALSGLSITGGYHRLFAHRTYSAAAPLRLFYLLFGCAAIQNSAYKWSSDHRAHHACTDTEGDPHNIREGFWWAHIGWLFRLDAEGPTRVHDLDKDPLVRFQHKYYMPLAVVFAALLPLSLGFLWGDPIGALLVAGFLRLTLQYHATFCVNSVAHYIGSQPYGGTGTARDSFITALLSLGEGYHNFHHRFQGDYRNGVRWYQFDPTKWFVWTASKVGITSNLRRTPEVVIQRARDSARASGAT